MGTTREEIKAWLLEGKKQGATHMLVVCDTWDYEDFPVYVMPGSDVKEVAIRKSSGDMSRLMEVYALHLDLDSQLNEHRSFHYEYPSAAKPEARPAPKKAAAKTKKAATPKKRVTTR